MAIFRGSRYTNTEVEYDANGRLAFNDRQLFRFNTKNCTEYVFCDGDRLDLLADKFYSDSRLWWIFLEANPSYFTEQDIQIGDVLLIPSASEVNNLYVK